MTGEVKNDRKVNEEEWEFKISLNDEVENPDKSPLKPKSRVSQLKSIQKKSELELEYSKQKNSKTRTELFAELNNIEEHKNKDLIQFASLHRRSIAFGIDLLLIGFFFHRLFILKPWALKNFHLYFANNYLLSLSDKFLESAFLSGVGVIGVFFFLVIPLAFYNVSLGKKMIGLRVRGSELYTISLFRALGRELFFKPLSILLIIGFITPFITKKRQSIHDLIANTLVIED